MVDVSAPGPARGDRRDLLKADCASCVGLCCVALAFVRSADFAIDKPAGDPCVNLADDDGCRIHDRLRPSGFRGCTVFDCFGAGQKVARGTFGGVSWRDDPDVRRSMFAVFPIMREVHELLWYLTEADVLGRRLGSELRAEVSTLLDATERVVDGTPEAILEADVRSHRDVVVAVLGRVSAALRAQAPRAEGKVTKPKHRIGPRADLMGARLRGADLRGVDLRGSYLIAADLRGADLRFADLIGADLRDTDLRGADLSTALFVTQPQIDAARGDVLTRLPSVIRRPNHWD